MPNTYYGEGATMAIMSMAAMAMLMVVAVAATLDEPVVMVADLRVDCLFLFSCSEELKRKYKFSNRVEKSHL